MADERLAAELAVQGWTDEAFVEGAFRLVLRRDPDPRRCERALAKLAEGTLSRAALIHELATSDEFSARAASSTTPSRSGSARASARRAHPLAAGAAGDRRARRRDAVGALAAAPRGACSRSATPSPRPRTSARCSARESSWSARISRRRDVDGLETVEADVRELPFPDALVRPGAARLDPRAHRRGQRACTASRRERRRSAPPGVARARPCPSGRRQPSRRPCPSESRATTAGSGRRTSAAGTTLFARARVLRRGAGGVRATPRRLARGARLRPGRRALRRRGRRHRPCSAPSFARSAPPPYHARRLWTTARRRARRRRHGACELSGRQIRGSRATSRTPPL